jgi:hypothetical protein
MRFSLAKDLLYPFVRRDRKDSYVHGSWAAGTQDRNGGDDPYRPF